MQDALSSERYSIIKDRRSEDHHPACVGRVHSRRMHFVPRVDSLGEPTRIKESFWTWWSWTGSNRRPQACKARALPAELQPPSLSIVLEKNGPGKPLIEVETNPTGLLVSSRKPSTRHPTRKRRPSSRFSWRSGQGAADRLMSGGPGWTRTTDLPLIRRTL